MSVSYRSLSLLGLMFAASVLAVILRPSYTNTEQTQTINLQALIPESFATWALAPRMGEGIVNPQQQETLERIYSQVLEREYRDSQTGRIVMLSLAYGGAQSKQSQVHRPEVCYPSQGFQVEQGRKDRINTALGAIPVQRLVARLGARNEPITYWIRIGDGLARGWMEQKVAVVMQGLSGQVADGVLFRVSNIDVDSASSYELHDRFVIDLLSVLSPDARKTLLGVQP